MNEKNLYLMLTPKTIELVPVVNVFTEIDSTNAIFAASSQALAAAVKCTVLG